MVKQENLTYIYIYIGVYSTFTILNYLVYTQNRENDFELSLIKKISFSRDS